MQSNIFILSLKYPTGEKPINLITISIINTTVKKRFKSFNTVYPDVSVIKLSMAKVTVLAITQHIMKLSKILLIEKYFKVLLNI